MHPCSPHEPLHVHPAGDLVDGRARPPAVRAIPEQVDAMRKHAERDDAVWRDGSDEVAERGHRGLLRK
jgi:hypothetical protein